ncbi:unnamed protein product [Brachionus calyciflorus]|uniref:Angiotensin-converting enzyme n=1 Tax=Brachionus calyciflorus TaxID=104777 RepID=A0A813NMN1_9BILA|nr:unnamed protein product [Brachionus calyciflorus]
MKFFKFFILLFGVFCQGALFNETDVLSQIEDISTLEINCFTSETCSRNWITKYNEVLRKLSEDMAYLKFKKEAHEISDHKTLINNFNLLFNKFLDKTKKIAKNFMNNDKNWNSVLRRMFKLASTKELSFDKEEDNIEYNKLSQELRLIYSKAKVCDNSTNECLALEPEITEIMTNSRDYDKLLWVWKGWHDATGPKMRDIYTRTVEIRNKAARENGYKDLSEKWMEDFEDDNFEKNYDDLFEQIRPLYEQLHAYVRRKLKNVYGSKYPPTLNPKLIPAHLLGNMWAQSWENIYELVTPYPEHDISNFTSFLSKQITANKMFQIAENFFVSIGLDKMKESFWKNSLIVKPKKNGRCHPSTFDFFNGEDYRIKMCVTIKSEKDFFRVHKEMTEIEYFMAYKNLPTIFRRSANPAFHEAIGDSISLSVRSLKHLKSIDLINFDSLTKEQEINFLMLVALNKVAFLPHAYIIDKWRWDMFRGKINQTNLNQKWWDFRESFQKIEAPIKRSENDFDIGSKFHVAFQMPYARHFVSKILEFQFFKALCIHAGHEGPLYNCDFYNSKKSGYFLKQMLELGASKHPSISLKVLTNQTQISTDAILEYFKPLQEWLIKENFKYSDKTE